MANRQNPDRVRRPTLPATLLATLTALNVPAMAALGLSIVCLALAAARLNPAWVAAVALTALFCSRAGRRPALRRRRPRVEDMRSLVVATAGMALTLIAAIVALVPYLPRLVHP